MKKKKFDQEMVSKVADAIIANEIQDFETGSKNFLMKINISGVEYNIWKSAKNDNKFEVLKIVFPHAKTAEKDSQKRLTKDEILKIIEKAL